MTRRASVARLCFSYAEACYDMALLSWVIESLNMGIAEYVVNFLGKR